MTEDVKSPGSVEVITKGEADAAQSLDLKELARAATPLIQQYIDGTRAIAQDKFRHEQRMAEGRERARENFRRRVFPLIWVLTTLGAVVVLWACYAGLWQIATHILTAAVAAAAGWTARPRYEPVEVERDS
jgi:hypothetical protein